MMTASSHRLTLKKRLGRILFGGLLLLAFFSKSFITFGYAQYHDPVLTITDLDSRNFPLIEVNLKSQNLSSPLRAQPSSFSVIEDGENITPDDVEELYNGIHFSLVINPEYSLTLRAENGQQYYSQMIEAVRSIGPDPDHPDLNRYSLHINPDFSSVELPNYDAWVEGIDAYQENMRKVSSSLESLELAISALEQSESTLDTVLLYITPYLHPTLLPDFFALVERAAAIGVPVHTWIVMDIRMLGSAYETDLQDALAATGGSLSSFTGSQEVPDPKQYLVGKGSSYHLSYQSQIRKSGSFDLVVEANLPDGTKIRSAAEKLELQVEPARLSFVNLPEQLELIKDEQGNVTPALLPVEVLIEFPDGNPRGIISATLFVNGTRVQTKQEAPYGSFEIDLNQELDFSQETPPEKIALEVRLEDALGLQGKTSPKSVALNVFEPQNPFFDEWYASPWLWLGLLAMAAIVSLLIFRKPGGKGISRTPRNEEPNEKPAEKTDQALASPTYVTLKSFGSLMKLDADQTPSAEKPHLLEKEITLIGKDASQANLVLEDPSLEPLHAEIHFFPDGRIRITDFNSTAGTYVNFKPVTTHGTNLQHADLIHFGRLLFRFNSSTRTQSAGASASPDQKPQEEIK